MKRRFYKQMTTLILLALLVPNLSSCASLRYWPVTQARILDADTEMPIEGAIVVAFWEGDIPIWPADFRSTCYHVESAVSDVQGRFRIPAYTEVKGHMINDKYVNWNVYSNGYRYSSRNSGGDYTKSGVYWLEKDDRMGSERLEYLMKLSTATTCGDAGDSVMNRLIFDKALLDEALELDLDQANERSIEILRFGYESLLYGDMEALERHGKRTAK